MFLSPLIEGTVTKPNFDLMAKQFIDKFRRGEFGKWVLDDMKDVEDWVRRNGGGAPGPTPTSQYQPLENETWVTS